MNIHEHMLQTVALNTLSQIVRLNENHLNQLWKNARLGANKKSLEDSIEAINGFIKHGFEDIAQWDKRFHENHVDFLYQFNHCDNAFFVQPSEAWNKLCCMVGIQPHGYIFYEKEANE